MVRQNISITVPEDVLEQIDAELTGTDSRSQWLTDAAKERLSDPVEA